MRRDVFKAIADPTRRAIIQLLAQQSLNMNEVAEQFEVSRPAISKHLKILAECGLVEFRKKGRERICEAKLGGLEQVYEWVNEYRQSWEKQPSPLDSYFFQLQKQNKGDVG